MGWMGPPSARRWVSSTWAQTCLRYFLGLVRERGVKKAWAAGRSSRWRESGLVPGRTPYREAQHSGGE